MTFEWDVGRKSISTCQGAAKFRLTSAINPKFFVNVNGKSAKVHPNLTPHEEARRFFGFFTWARHPLTSSTR